MRVVFVCSSPYEYVAMLLTPILDVMNVQRVENIEWDSLLILLLCMLLGVVLVARQRQTQT